MSEEWETERDYRPPPEPDIFISPPGACAVYSYSFADAEDAFKVVRFDATNGHKKKSFQQWSLDGTKWVPKQLIPAGERPLYDLPHIDHQSALPVLVVEGEKAAQAAKEQLRGFFAVTTWAGGANAVNTADWEPLLRRHVIIWPDNDAPGLAAAKAIQAKLPHARIVDIPLNFPEGWDLADPLPDGFDNVWVRAQIAGAKSSEKKDAPNFPPSDASLIDPIIWEGLDVPIRRWLVPGLIPWHVPTMLSGMGGIGKTLLGLQLAHAAAANQKWIGRSVEQVKVLGVFCEDDADELHRRLNDLNLNTSTSFGDLENLRLMIRDGLHSSLMDYDGPYGAGEESDFFTEVVQQAKAFGAQLLILDSLYNFFHGNENNRVQVSQFVYALKKLAKQCDAALVFLAHPSKSGISTGEGYAGSTAWHDAVRSRLYLTEEGQEGEEKRLVLKTMKANYAPKDGQIEVYYQGGMLWPRDTEATTDPIYKQVQVDDVFLICLRATVKQKRRVTDSKQGHYAPKIFARMKDLNRGFGQKDFEAAMSRLFQDGRIVNGPVSDGYKHFRPGIIEAQSAPVSSQNEEI